MPAFFALIAVTAVWGVTFVQVKDAVALYPLFAFLAVRFAIASLVLAVPAAGRMRSLGRRGWVAGVALGLLLATGYGLQTAGLERTTVSNAGFITGLYVVFTPLLALLLFRTRVGGAVWLGVALAVAGLAMLSGVGAGDPVGDLLVLAGSAAYSVQIVLMERYAPRYDPSRSRRPRCWRRSPASPSSPLRSARSSCRAAGRSGARCSSPASSRVRSPFSFRPGRSSGRARPGPRSRSRWSRSSPASSASGSQETGWAHSGWCGCAMIMAGILVAEPEAGRTLRRFVARPNV